MISRRYKVFIAFCVLAVVAGIYALTGRTRFAKSIPPSFRDARFQGALISQGIVDSSNQLSEDLKRINELDKDKKYADALTLTNEVIKKSEAIREQAIRLSHEIETMARALPEIDSPDARQAALDAISNRLALISRLINYSGHLGELLNSLRDKFSGGELGDTRIANLIDQVNAEVTAVNNFNHNATESMERFDKIIETQK